MIGALETDLQRSQEEVVSAVMDLPQHLIRVIESTHVAFEGLSHPLKVVSVDPDPPPPHEPRATMITVEIEHNGETKRASCTLNRSRLEDEREVVTTLAERMRGVLTGEPR